MSMPPLPPEFPHRSTISLLRARAESDPERLAFVAPAGTQLEARVSRSQWVKASGAVAGGLRDGFGLKRGSKVAWMLDNSNAFEALILYQAVHLLGAINVPMNSRLTSGEIEAILVDSGATALVANEPSLSKAIGATEKTIGVDRLIATVTEDLWPRSFQQLLDSGRQVVAQEIDEADVATLLYTSGTTGRPKGVVLSHGNVVASGIGWADAFSLGPEEIFHTPFPVFSGAGLHYTAMAAVFAGSAFLIDKPSVEAILGHIERERTTIFAAVPSMYEFMLDWPLFAVADLSSVHTLGYGGSRVSETLIRRLRDAFPSAGQIQTYGLTEAGPGGIFLPKEWTSRFPGAIGTRPAGRFTSVRVVDECGNDVAAGVRGEIALRGPSIMVEYYQNPEATAEAIPDGWLRTGDIGCFDEYGAIYHIDRKKDLILRGGFNIAASEVESVLLSHVDVVDAAVVGKSHAKLGETVVAFVVVRTDCELNEKRLIEYCSERLADYKLPAEVHFRRALPLNASGKVSKSVLRDEVR